MSDSSEVKLVVISGPESTGKTELARNLAKKLCTTWVPESAREYIENLKRPYSFADVEIIARFQAVQEKTYGSKLSSGLLIFDTWFIITKVWFDLEFGKCPEWIINHIQSTKIDLFLVCNTDLPWIPDQVRENGGERREQLFRLYCNEISSFGFKYEIINGTGTVRVENAIKALKLHELVK
jgi:NadR type nicotinamide-nucleotide adenylyltransferase